MFNLIRNWLTNRRIDRRFDQLAKESPLARARDASVVADMNDAPTEELDAAAAIWDRLTTGGGR